MKDLIQALSVFEESWYIDLGDEGSYNSLTRLISENHINLISLKEEYAKALSTQEFDWNDIAVKSNLLNVTNLYSQTEIKNIVQVYLQDYLYPEEKLSATAINTINFILDIISKGNLRTIQTETLTSYLSLFQPLIRPFHFYRFSYFFDSKITGIKVDNNKMWVIDGFKVNLGPIEIFKKNRNL